MLTEIFKDEQIIYMRARVKHFDIFDSVALKLEAELNPKMPEERFAVIQQSEMKVTGAIRKVVSDDCWRNWLVDWKGVYKIS